MAVFDAFLKLPDVKGEATREGQEGAIEIKSFSWGGNAPAGLNQSGGISAGTVNLQDFVIMKKTDSTSVALFESMCTGKPHNKVTVTLLKQSADPKGKPLEYLVYTFNQLFVTSMNWSGSEGGDPVPYEQVTFAFGNVKVTYVEQTAEGTAGGKHETGWDLQLRKVV